MKLQISDKRAFFVLTIVSAMVFFASCGGKYSANWVADPSKKLSIADDLFSRRKYSKAAAEYKDFLATFAGNEKSDYAQFKLAESYRLDKDYALAAVEYRILINDYGYSDYVDDAFFLEALCDFEQSPRAELDQTKTYQALDRVNRFLSLFPNSPRTKEAEALLERIYNKLGKKEFLNAKLYLSRHKYKAALIYLDKIIDLYPKTVWAARSHYYKGFIMEEKGYLKDAIAEYRSAANSKFDFKEKERAKSRIDALNMHQSSAEVDDVRPK